ncbi:MAG: dicarboxylate/amino acid:cation symporter [Synergistaceae bacterium]|nr:dicarboxylate/amino acid:cation symporter [Synergistaceae bacterium]
MPVSKNKSLLLKISIGFCLGIIFGFIAGPMLPNSLMLQEYVMPFIEVSGKIFLRLLSMLIVPLVFSSLVAGLASIGEPKTLGRIGGKTLVLYLLTTVIALFIGLVLVNFFQPGSLMKVPENLRFNFTEIESISDMIVDIFPSNPIASMVNANMLQIIVFAFFFGVACVVAGEPGRKIAEIFDHIAKVMCAVTRMVMWFAPFGVFALIADTAAKFGIFILAPFAGLIMVVYAACLVHFCVIYSAMVMCCKKSPLWFFKGIREAGITAFVTRSSAATLPVTLANVRENFGVSEGISSFVVPLGATINMDGTAIYLAVCAVFVAQAFHIPITFNIQMGIIVATILSSIGAAGVPGSGLIMLTAVLTSAGLPVEGAALVAGIDVLLSSARTFLNVTGDAAVCVVVASSEGEELAR